MRRKIVCLILTIVCFMSGIVVFSGCNIKYVLKTLDEVEKSVWKNFFDENGKARMERWGEKDEGADIWHPYYNSSFHFGEVKSFKVTPLKSVESRKTEEYFLVEFDTSGHIVGRFGSGGKFSSYPSPFKMLDIPDDERYLEAVNKEQFLYATNVNGFMAGIYEAAYSQLNLGTPAYYSKYDIELFDYEVKGYIKYDSRENQYIVGGRYAKWCFWEKNLYVEAPKRIYEKVKKKYKGIDLVETIKTELYEIRDNSSYYKQLIREIGQESPAYTS